MKHLLLATLAGLALALPFGGVAGPDETQKLMIQRAQDAKKKLAEAQAATGAQGQKLMDEHMKMMSMMMEQMRAAKPAAGMSSQQMREWMDEHLKLMDQMTSQMMEEHHMMMQGMGK